MAATDFRRFDPRFQGANLRANLKLVERLAAIAQSKGVKPSQLAIAWAMSRGTVPIPGTRRIRYVEDNVPATDIDLTPVELKALDDAAPIGVAIGDRYSPGMMEQVER